MDLDRLRCFEADCCLFWLVWLFPKDQDRKKTKTARRPSRTRSRFFFSKMAPVSSWVAHAIDGATTSPHDARTMATAMEALDTELRTPRKAANEAGAVARNLLVNPARQGRAARRGTSVLRVNETQEEASIPEVEDKGRAPPNTREELRQRAKSGVRDAPCTGGAQGCRAAEQRLLAPTSKMETTRTSPFRQSEGTKSTGKIKCAQPWHGWSPRYGVVSECNVGTREQSANSGHGQGQRFQGRGSFRQSARSHRTGCRRGNIVARRVEQDDGRSNVTRKVQLAKRGSEPGQASGAAR